MSDSVREKAQQSQDIVAEVTAIALAEPNADIVPLEKAPPQLGEEIRRRMAEIDIGDTNSIVAFGSGAQAELQQISQAML
ncbi:MAG: toxic anion resistance protein, partial [Pseudooceanicola sp.]|nr:toxic anion resistance protein [Pseudooceanicola sp.]